MRLGRVKLVIDCVVDLSNKEMVASGKEVIVEDLEAMLKYGEMFNRIDEEEDKTLTEADLPEFLTQE